MLSRPGAAAAGRAGARKGSRKRPKLTVEDLATKPMGFAYLLTDLADDFRKVYKGPGHEVTHPSQRAFTALPCLTDLGKYHKERIAVNGARRWSSPPTCRRRKQSGP